MVALRVDWQGDFVNEEHKENMRKYYVDNHLFFRLFWMNRKNLALHMGLWDSNTNNLHEALTNENRIVADALGIESSDMVLDAGCGIGGPAIWMAEQYAANITAIDIVDENIERARKNAKKRGVDHKVRFEMGDYSNLHFGNGCFSKIYMIESLACAPDKESAMVELYRLISPAGRLVIIDYFIGKEDMHEDDQALVINWSDTWSMKNLKTLGEFENILRSTGFQDIELMETTGQVWTSIRRLNRVSKAVYPLAKLSYHLRLIPNLPDKEILEKEEYMFSEGLIKHVMFVIQRENSSATTLSD